MESLDSFLFFTTLTFNNQFLPRITTSTGVTIPYADVYHLQLLFKRLRNTNAFGRPFRYFAVTERGSDNGRPHAHILWFLPRFDGEDYCDGLSLQSVLWQKILDNWVVNFGSKRVPDYRPLLTYKSRYFRGKLERNYDTHFVIPSLTSDGISSVAFYVVKYLLKSSNKERRLQQALKLNLDQSEYDYIWSLVKSRSVRSEHFGLNLTDTSQSFHIVDYLRSCVRRSDYSLSYPQYFNPDTGQSFPLSLYYKKRPYIYSFEDHLNFVMDKSPYQEYDINVTKYISDIEKSARINSIVDNDFSLNLNLLFD